MRSRNRPACERNESSPSSQGPSPRLLNLKQAAVYLGLSFWSVRDYVLAGLIPSVKMPGLQPREGDKPKQTLRRVLVDVQDLDRFIEQYKNARDCPSAASSEPPVNTADSRPLCPSRAHDRGRR
jgi:hypothetical protein